MTLTLEQVRQTRFHLARRNGYEPVDVDNFVDKVEVTLAQLGEENATLSKQVEALTAGEGGAVATGEGSAEADELRQQLADANAEVERLRGELDSRAQELDGVRTELDGVRAELETAKGALAEGDQGEVVGRLQAELDQAKGELSGRDERTLVKLVVERSSDRVLGAHMVGEDAPEIMQGLAIAIRCGATKRDFDTTIGIHPTAAEEFVTMRFPVTREG